MGLKWLLIVCAMNVTGRSEGIDHAICNPPIIVRDQDQCKFLASQYRSMGINIFTKCVGLKSKP